LRLKLDSVFTQHNLLAYVSGHEHTLQVLKSKGKHLHLVSGFGMENHAESLTTGDNTIFALLAPGFMRLDFLKDESVRLSIIEAAKDSANRIEIFSMKLR